MRLTRMIRPKKCIPLATLILATTGPAHAMTPTNQTAELRRGTANQTAKKAVRQIRRVNFVGARENFEKVHRMILQEHMDRVDEEKLYLAATTGMLSALNRDGRKWNALLNPHEFEEFHRNLKGENTGIGVQFQFIPQTGTAFIKRILPGSPAEQSGIQKGDQILSVDGKMYKGLSKDEMVDDVRGPSGKSVALKVLRGDKVLKMDITRAKVKWEAVEGHVSDSNMGILKVRSFTRNSAKMIGKHLSDMQPKVKGLILDLRHNRGGFFDMALASADHFLPKGQVISIVRGRNGKPKVFKSNNDQLINKPLVVLINNNTSSGAELLAATLKESLGARLVGEKSFGKWNSQIVKRLPNNFAVKFTVYEFLTPQKKSFQNVGLSPDVSVVNDLDSAIIQDLPLSGLAPAGGLDQANPRDRQLQTALQLLKMMI